LTGSNDLCTGLNHDFVGILVMGSLAYNLRLRAEAAWLIALLGEVLELSTFIPHDGRVETVKAWGHKLSL